MQVFRFKRIETFEYDVVVHADSYEQANARVSVGTIDNVRCKEGVEVVDCNGRTEVVDDPVERVYVMAYSCSCDVNFTDESDHVGGSNCPACGAWCSPFATKEKTKG